MLNPFKKKEDGFSLDETSLPSLNDEALNATKVEMPQVQNGSNPYSNILSASNDLQMSGSQSPNQLENSQMGNFNQNNNNHNTLHNDLIKAKMESLEAKTALIEAKLSNIDQKLDMIYHLIHEEVSEETKNKVSVNDMMQNVRHQ